MTLDSSGERSKLQLVLLMVISKSCTDSASFVHSALCQTDEWTTHVMDLAASNGKLQIVRYLHEYRSEGCTAAAMDDAASSGHLHVVKFLHLHRLEGCTAEAMDGASENGELTVVQFLHANRKEGCTARAMDSAIRTGNLCMVKFLHENRREGYHEAVLEMAVADDVEDSSLIQQYRQPEALKDMKARREFLNEKNFLRLLKQGRFAVNKELQG